MPSRPSVPRIRVDSPDSSSCDLSPSSTLDIKDVLGQAKPLPKLLAEDSVFDGVDDAPYFEDGRLQNFPSFPVGRRPPLFVLNSHRAQLPFPIRPDAFELGDFCMDEEDVYPLLTAPTVPRMKMMIKERLYVQKWVNTLTPDNPPRHIPWTCEKPATKRDWIAEGSIFPADMVKLDKFSPEHHGTIREYNCIADANRPSAVTDRSREVCALSGAFGSIHASTESHASTRCGRTKSAGDDPGILRGESKTPCTPHPIVRTSRPSTSSTLLPSIGLTSRAPESLLAARRGKSPSSLKLTGTLIEHLEYPDIPTAFRGSPIVWSPRFDTVTVPSFTDHDSMLLDLQSKCAAIESGASVYIQESLRPQSEPIPTSLGVDEQVSTRELATSSNSLWSTDSQAPREIIADSSIFLPNNLSTPVKGPSVAARLRFVPRLHPVSASRSPGNRWNDPPGVPLPPRPALINPSTPPHVRSILKKAKSVRFEDVTTGEAENRTSPVPLPQTTPERSPPLPLATSSRRPRTPIPSAAKSLSSPLPLKETLGRNIQKKSAAKSRRPPKQVKPNEKLDSTCPNVGNALEPSRPTLAATLADRPCRIAHIKENTNSTLNSQAQAKQKGSAVTEIDVRRGIEGTTRSRLSTPLRSIFRFR